jgi:hypothetical protein
VVVEGGRLVAVGFGLSALGAVVGRIGNLDEKPTAGRELRPPTADDGPPSPIDLAEEDGCDQIVEIMI